MKTKRTQEEIVAKIAEVKSRDWMGTITSDLLEFLDYDHAKPYLKEEVTADKWKEIIDTVKAPAEQIKEYMEFAWEKANNYRGISAGRSLEHMYAWLWLDGQDEFLADNRLDDYEFYGKDHLVSICNLYGLDSKKWDDGVRKNDEEW